MGKIEPKFNSAKAFEMLINYISNSNNLTPKQKKKIPKDWMISYDGAISLIRHRIKFYLKDKNGVSKPLKAFVYRNGIIKIF